MSMKTHSCRGDEQSSHPGCRYEARFILTSSLNRSSTAKVASLNTALVILPPFDVVHPLYLQLIHYHELIKLLPGLEQSDQGLDP